MFGQAKPFGSPFGQTPQQPTFGNRTTTTGFGASAFGQQPAQPGFGSFGQPQQPSSSVFGQPATPAFGSAAPSFGQPATTQSAFGSFGQQQQPTTSLFGSTQNAQGNTSLFGQPSTSTGAFGAKPAFGFNSTQPTLFGSNAPTSTFGSFGSTTAPAFGQAQQMGGMSAMTANGTAIAKYQPLAATDTLVKNGQTTSVNTRQQCVTAMKEYENKSLEELRIEDYMANRKGPQAGSVQPSGGLFNTAPQSTGLFGAPASQPQTTGLFGTQTTNNTMSGFGANTSTFGQTQQPASAFGQTQSTGLFGKPNNAFGAMTSTFGQQPQQPANNLFGAKPFGAPATTAPTGFTGFGTATSTAATPFGAVKPFGQTTGLFGASAVATTAAPAFGAANTSFGGFGATGAFGQAATSTAQPAQGASLFSGLSSAAPNATGGLFGQKPATGFGAFGAPASSAATGFGGLGTFTSTPGSAFGTFNQTNTFKPAATGFTGFNAQTSAAPTFNSGLGLGTAPLFGGTNSMLQPHQQAAPQVHQTILSMATSPYGDNPIFKDLKPLGNLNEDALKPTNPAAQKAILESSSSQYKISPKVTSGLKVKPIGSTLSKKSLFGGLEEFDSSIEESFSLKPNAKRLIIKPKVPTPSGTGTSIQNTSLPTSKLQEISPIASRDDRRSLRIAPPSEPENARRISWLHSNLDKVPQQGRGDTDANTTMQDLVSSGKTKSSTIDINKQSISPSLGILRQDPNRANISSLQHKSHHYSGGLNANDSILSTKSFLDDTNADISLINTDYSPHPTGIVLTRSGYYTIPPLDKLTDFLTDDGKCIVPNFTIGRKGYGNVYFGETMDVAGLNIDELVHFRNKEVIIYPDDENKPPVGEGLNRKAQITLDQVWPHDKTLHEPIKDKQRLEEMNFEGKLRAVCDKHDTRFVEYRPETGSWVFKVDHFSKYGLSDSDEEDNPADPKKLKPNVPTKDGVKPKAIGTLPKTKQNKSGEITIPSEPLFNLNKSQSHGYKDLSEDREMEFVNFTSQYGNYPAQPVSPSADLAIDMGTDSHKLQLMKASLFNDEADDYETKSISSEQYGERDSPDQIVPSKRPFTFSTSTHSLLSKEISSTTSSSTIETPSLSPMLPTIREHETRKMDKISEIKLIPAKPMKFLPLVLKPKVATIRAADKVVPLSESILTKIAFRSIASDVALFHGRRFRIGWNHANCLTILSTSITCRNQTKIANINDVSALFSGRSITDSSKSVLKRIKIFSLSPTDGPIFNRSIENHLQCRLKFSTKETIADSDCPYYVPRNGIEALQLHHQLAGESFTEYPLSEFHKISFNVWSLCVALWGYQEELEDIENDDHISIMLRRDLFSKWLETTVNTETLKRIDSDVNYLQHLLQLLTAHKVNEACELAFNNGDLNLSLLLAQAGGSNVVRALMAKQLHSWHETEADKFIDVHRVKAMMLVSGQSTFQSTKGMVNIYEDLDWIKSLAINIWYLSSPTASITDALIKYENAAGKNAAAPTPSYLKDFIAVNNADRIQDIRYHILKLYSKRSHSLEKLLNPATHSVDLMDFRLSWLLLQILKSIGYQHCSEQSEAQLHVSFASQLENYGLWHWSIFVLLHISNKAKRELSVQQYLYRYIDLSRDDDYRRKEAFIVDQLGIPEKWIFWAKAVRAGALKQYREQAEYLLKAKQWAQAHEIIMEHIAPDAIINDNTRYIKDLLDRFEDPRLVPNWSNQGMILLDYLDMIAKIESLKTIHERDIETRWEGLKPQLSELCSRIKQFPCPTAKHRLCQSEIAQGLAILVNGMEVVSTNINPCLLVHKALENLPLPEEYAKQKMRSLLDNSNLVEMLQYDQN